MSKLPNFVDFNKNRQDLLKIRTKADETILFSKEEAKEALVRYIKEELDFFADEISLERKQELEARLMFKFKQIETSMIKHVNDKINSLTERIVSLTTDKIIEREVNKRVDIRLKEIKDSL